MGSMWPPSLFKSWVYCHSLLENVSVCAAAARHFVYFLKALLTVFTLKWEPIRSKFVVGFTDLDEARWTNVLQERGQTAPTRQNSRGDKTARGLAPRAALASGSKEKSEERRMCKHRKQWNLNYQHFNCFYASFYVQTFIKKKIKQSSFL